MLATRPNFSTIRLPQLPAIAPGKSPVWAFVLGVFLGPIGTGLYLRTWMDFLIPLAVALLVIFLLGLPAPLTWFISGAWGVWRVTLANRSV